MELTKDEAYKSLKGLKSAKRKSHINKLLKIVSKQMDIARVYCNKKDESLINGFEVVKSEVVGGIIAENSDGDIQVDYSYDALLEEAFSDNVSEIRKKLLN